MQGYKILEKKNIFLLIGSGIALIQLLFNRSLWVDEAMLAINIITKSSAELLSPLSLNQVAPILFLQIEKIFASIIPNEIGLRVFPYFCFVISALFFSKIVETKQSQSISLIALSLYLFNPNLIYFSSEVKQYMCDILVICTFYFILTKSFNKEVNRFTVLSTTGVIAVFLSNITPIVLLTSGIYIVYSNKKNIIILKQFTLVITSWIASFGFYYFKFIQNHPTRNSMLEYWEAKNAFLPIQILSKETATFIAKNTYALIRLASPFDNLVCYFIISILFLFGSLYILKFSGKSCIG